MATDEQTVNRDVSGQADRPEDDPEAQRQAKLPDDHAAWVIACIHDFDERTCKELRARGETACNQYNGKQWDPAIANQLKGEHRPCLTFNEIRPKIDAIVGEERRNREDWIAKPREGSDESEAQIRTALLKYVREVNELQADESRAFEDVAVPGYGGLSAHLVQVPGEDAPMLRITYRSWRELRWDPSARARDFSDGQWMALSLHVSVERLRELFPDFERDIVTEYEALRSDPIEPEVDVGERVGVSRYSDGDMRPALFDSTDQRIRAVEFYHRTTRTARIAHLRTQTQGEITRDVTEADATLTAQLDELVQRGLAYIETRKLPAIMGSLVVGRRTLARWWSPFNGGNAFGDPYFPIFIAFASDTDGYVMGLVEPMVDAQSEVNKRWSMTVDNYLKQGRSGGVYEDGAFENETEVKKHWGETGYWAKVKTGAIANSRFKEHTPKPTDQALIGLFQMAENAMDRVSNIEKARLGLTSQETSGVAIRTRALQSALVQVKAFDNFRHMQLLLGKFINANLGLIFPTTRTLRLTMPGGQTESVTLNQPVLQQGAWKIANATSAESQYDITMDLTPANATFREMQAQNLANLLGQIGPALKEIPAFLPAHMLMVAGLIRMLDGLPNREEIVKEIDAGIQRFKAPKPEPPPEPPKVAISLRGELGPEAAADLADGKLDQPAAPAPPPPPKTGEQPPPGLPIRRPMPVPPARPNPMAGMPFRPVALSAPTPPGLPATVQTAMNRPVMPGGR